MKRARPHSRGTIEATRLLGARIREARIDRRWTEQDLAERLGASRGTVARLERGEPTVSLGLAFEAAWLLNVPLFHPDPERVRAELAHTTARLAVLPRRVRRTRIEPSDDF